ncbi:hypothetical protein [uncultured Roseibium sp.]|uniref:hypothetical protein n=1 Tax=uncultured Roseibium sp. TaxID=1936171 RepID=UPI002621B7E5|nr:hypothetical protein [uncultured Roseibium sp.]
MRFADPIREQSSVLVASHTPQLDTQSTTDVTAQDVRTMMLYLRKARDRAIDIRDRAPAGSYLEGVLKRTIDGITLELSQLEYLLACKPADASSDKKSKRRMRPAI